MTTQTKDEIEEKIKILERIIVIDQRHIDYGIFTDDETITRLEKNKKRLEIHEKELALL